MNLHVFWLAGATVFGPLLLTFVCLLFGCSSDTCLLWLAFSPYNVYYLVEVHGLAWMAGDCLCMDGFLNDTILLLLPCECRDAETREKKIFEMFFSRSLSPPHLPKKPGITHTHTTMPCNHYGRNMRQRPMPCTWTGMVTLSPDIL